MKPPIVNWENQSTRPVLGKFFDWYSASCAREKTPLVLKSRTCQLLSQTVPFSMHVWLPELSDNFWLVKSIWSNQTFHWFCSITHNYHHPYSPIFFWISWITPKNLILMHQVGYWTRSAWSGTLGISAISATVDRISSTKPGFFWVKRFHSPRGLGTLGEFFPGFPGMMLEKYLSFLETNLGPWNKNQILLEKYILLEKKN